jgi:light-regulated signal transduction histidine kinase (bacteriophytochrome)
LLNALLTYARIGQTELVVEPVDLDKLLDYVLEDLAAFLIEHHVDLKRTARLPVLVCNAIRVGGTAKSDCQCGQIQRQGCPARRDWL